jgi:hypothetical protein
MIKDFIRGFAVAFMGPLEIRKAKAYDWGGMFGAATFLLCCCAIGVLFALLWIWLLG